MTADQAFKLAFNGEPNFMTPEIIEIGSTPHHHYEISRGDGLFGGDLFGVTILTLNGERTDLSKSFDNLDEARRYIDQI